MKTSNLVTVTLTSIRVIRKSSKIVSFYARYFTCIDPAISKLFLRDYQAGSIHMESRELEGQMDMACNFKFIMKIKKKYCNLVIYEKYIFAHMNEYISHMYLVFIHSSLSPWNFQSVEGETDRLVSNGANHVIRGPTPWLLWGREGGWINHQWPII